MLNLDRTRDLPKIEKRIRQLADRSDTPPALVVGTSINALGVVRSLGAQRIPVVWLTSNPNSFVNCSRFACCNISCSDVFYDGLVSTLMKLGPMFQVRPVLFLTHDFQVRRLSEAREVLSRHYLFHLPSKDVVEKMLSKVGFSELALESGLPVPTTYIMNTVSELDQFLGSYAKEGSWVVKPYQKSDRFEEHFGKAIKVKSPEEWRKFKGIYQDVDVPILIQSWVEGPDANVAFCLVVFNSSGRCLISFGGKKIRQFKPEVGNTASAERFFEEKIREESIGFFEKHYFAGMGSLEFKYNEITKKFYVIEPTVGRTNLQSEIATINGYNLPAIYYYGVVGDGKSQRTLIEAAAFSTRDRIWMRFGADLSSCWTYFKQGRLSVREWLRPYHKPVSFVVFRLNDPRPFLALIHMRLISLAKLPVRWLRDSLLRWLRLGPRKRRAPLVETER